MLPSAANFILRFHHLHLVGCVETGPSAFHNPFSPVYGLQSPVVIYLMLHEPSTSFFSDV